MLRIALPVALLMVIVSGPRLLNKTVWPTPTDIASGSVMVYGPLGVMSMMRATTLLPVVASSGHAREMSASRARDRYDTSEGYIVVPPKTCVKLLAIY